MRHSLRRPPRPDGGQLWLPASAGGDPIPAGTDTHTLAGCATVYEFEGLCLRLKPRSWAMFQSALRAFGCEREHRDGSRPGAWRTVGPPDCANRHRVEAHLDVLQRRDGLSPGTVKGYLGNVATVAARAGAIVGDRVVADALSLVKRPPVPDPRPRCPPDDAPERIGALCQHPAELAIVRLMLQGCRPREVFALRLSDWSEETGVLAVTRSRKGETTRKNGHDHHVSVRSDPDLETGVLWAIENHDALYPAHGGAPSDDLLFPFASERWYGERLAVWRHALGEDADAYLPPGTGLYALRHLAVTRLFAAGVKDADIAAHVGHRNTQTIAKYGRGFRGASGGDVALAAITSIGAPPRKPPPPHAGVAAPAAPRPHPSERSRDERRALPGAIPGPAHPPPVGGQDYTKYRSIEPPTPLSREGATVRQLRVSDPAIAQAAARRANAGRWTDRAEQAAALPVPQPDATAPHWRGLTPPVVRAPVAPPPPAAPADDLDESADALLFLLGVDRG